MLRYIRQSGAIEKAQHVSDLYLKKALEEIGKSAEWQVKKSI